MRRRHDQLTAGCCTRPGLLPPKQLLWCCQLHLAQQQGDGLHTCSTTLLMQLWVVSLIHLLMMCLLHSSCSCCLFKLLQLCCRLLLLLPTSVPQEKLPWSRRRALNL